MSAKTLVAVPLLSGGRAFIDPDIVVEIRHGGGDATGRAVVMTSVGGCHLCAGTPSEVTVLLRKRTAVGMFREVTPPGYVKRRVPYTANEFAYYPK